MYTTLVKLFLKENISLKRLMGFDVRKSKVKAILIGLALLYTVVVFVGLFGYLFFDLGKLLDQMGQNEILISFLCVYVLGMSLLITFFRANGSLFYYKDYEILSPLPIHPRTVLLAKMTVLLVMLYLMSFVISLPIMFSYFYWNQFNATSIIILLLGFFFIPLIPVVIMSLIALGIAQFTRRFRRSKLLNLILMFVVFLGIFMGSFSLNDVEQNPLTGQIDLFKGISDVYIPFDWYRIAVHQGSWIHLLYVILINAVIFGLYMYFIQGLVHKTNQKGIRVNMKKNGRPVVYQEKPLMWALIGKEFKKFFNVTIYAFNAGFGPVILMVTSIASLFYQKDLEQILGEAMGAELPLEVMIIALIGFAVSMTYTPAISLSLEGKNFWILKSLPIQPKTIMYSKILFNMLLIVPIALISIVLFGISLSLPLINQLIMMVLVILFALVISFFDAIVNLYTPKFDYMNEVEVVKQSAGALLGVFGGFALMGINGISYYYLHGTMSESLVFLVLIAINGLLLVPLVWFMEKKSEKIFRSLKA